MNFKEVYEAVKVAMQAKIPVYIEGQPGGGKSSIPMIVAKELGWWCKQHNASLGNDTDILGLPGTTAGNDMVVWRKIGVFAEVMKSGSPGVLVIEDLPHASKEVQAALWPIVHPGERRIGDDRMPDHVSIVATGNRIEDAGSGARALLTPLRDRFEAVFTLDVDYKIAFEHLRTKYAGLDGPMAVIDAAMATRADAIAKISPRRWDAVCNWVHHASLADLDGKVVAGGAKDVQAAGVDIENIVATATISRQANELATAVIQDLSKPVMKASYIKKIPVLAGRIIKLRTGGKLSEEHATKVVSWCGGVNTEELMNAVNG